jgi:methyl-accepting chemotaxis protein
MQNINFRTKLLIFGITVSIIPLTVSLVLTFSTNRKFIEVASEESIKLADADLNHIVSNVHASVTAQNELALEMVKNALQVSQHILDQAGKVSLIKDKPVSWNAVNQFTKKSSTIVLPAMAVDGKWIGQNRDINKPSMIVDKTRELSVETCTLFQRINREGDMLRVCTNVQNLDGTRAVGTYIPASNSDGSPNAVISTILKGNTFQGRAFVVNAWYLTAYKPIMDNSGEIIGILYVGIKQNSVAKAILKTIADIKIGESGQVVIINSKGEYIVPEKGKSAGDNEWEASDADGRKYIQDIIKKGLVLKDGEILDYRYQINKGYKAGNFLENNKRTKLYKIKYSKSWDWIVMAGSFEDEFLISRDKIAAMGRQSIQQISIISFGRG